MAETIKLKLANGMDWPVKAVVRGDLAIHAENRRTFALSHVPSGLRIDGLYFRAVTLKSVLRNLSKLDWSGSVESIRGNDALIGAFIAEMSRVELGEHWAFRRQWKRVQPMLDNLDDEAALAAMEAAKQCQ